MRGLAPITASMALFVALLTGLLAAGCGEQASTAGDPPTGPTSSPSSSSPGPVDFDLVQMITVTGAGGSVSPDAVALRSRSDARGYARQFPAGSALATQVLHAAEQPVAADRTLYAAVVALGCDAPGQVEVARSGSGFRIDAVPVPSPRPECFAPMTTVALVAIADRGPAIASVVGGSAR